MANVTIKIAQLDDVPAVANLFDRYRQFYGQPENLILAEKFIRSRISQRDSIVLVAIDAKDQAIGFCQLYPTFCSVIAAPILVLYDLFVLPTTRRSGTAKSLLIAADEQAKLAGVTRMELATAKSNLPAQVLYEALGWEKETNYFHYKKDIVAD